MKSSKLWEIGIHIDMYMYIYYCLLMMTAVAITRNCIKLIWTQWV